MTELAPQSDRHLDDLNLPLNGRYQVLGVLAAKLWTRTYRAQDLQRPQQPHCVITQLKAIPIVPNYRAAIRDLFVREATLLEQLGQHPQIPSFQPWFEDEQGFYVVQEFVRGRSLSLDLLPHQPWTPEQVLQLLRQVLAPLVWVHRHGGIHGNLKPDNLWQQEDGRWLAIDFSSLGVLQQTLMAAHGLFVPPRTAAQQGYQPLEQLQGLACAASDVYALGMIAVQALTGIQPVDFQVDPDTVKILWQEHLPDRASSLQQQLVPILENMVQWDLPQRYANAQEVLLALETVRPVSVPTPAAAPVATALAYASVGGTQGDKVMDTDAEPVIPAPPQRVAAVALATPIAAPPTAAVPLHPPIEVPAVMATPPPPEQPPSEPTLPLKTLLQSTLGSPAMRLGVGGVAVATGIAAVGWGLLNSVDWSTKTGKLWQRVAAATNLNNSNSRSVKSLSEQWRQDWQRAATTFQQVETAAKQGEWAKAKTLSTTIPDIPYWRDRSQSVLQQANLPVATAAPAADAETQLAPAFDYARAHKFNKALAELAKIPPGTAIDAVVKAKTQEYQEKQNVRADFDLQRAYDRAIERDFEQALAYLYQIPAGTNAYATAQTKIAEYKQKRDIQAEVRRTSVSDRPTPPQVSALPPAPAAIAVQPVAMQLDPDIQALNQQAETWLRTADRQLQAGQLQAALTSLAQVPLGTPAYAGARDRILTVTAQLQTPPNTAPVVLQAEHPTPPQVAPETQPLILGRAQLQWVDRPD